MEFRTKNNNLRASMRGLPQRFRFTCVLIADTTETAKRGLFDGLEPHPTKKGISSESAKRQN
jgi:hypothetical protein